MRQVQGSFPDQVHKPASIVVERNAFGLAAGDGIGPQDWSEDSSSGAQAVLIQGVSG